MMHLGNIDEVYRPRNILIWLLSAFEAGFINAAGFLATGGFVSHVTGWGTSIGIAIEHNELFYGAELFIIPVAFISGGVAASLMLDGKEAPRYHIVQLFITILLGIVVLLGESSWIPGDKAFDDDRDYNFYEFCLIALLVFICGLQNALTTWATKGKIRVTHLTGLSTDIGLNLPGNFSKKLRREEPRVNALRISTFLSFSVGSFISAVAFPKYGFHCFFLVIAISCLLVLISYLNFEGWNFSSDRSI